MFTFTGENGGNEALFSQRNILLPFYYFLFCVFFMSNPATQFICLAAFIANFVTVSWGNKIADYISVYYLLIMYFISLHNEIAQVQKSNDVTLLFAMENL